MVDDVVGADVVAALVITALVAEVVVIVAVAVAVAVAVVAPLVVPPLDASAVASLAPPVPLVVAALVAVAPLEPLVVAELVAGPAVVAEPLELDSLNTGLISRHAAHSSAHTAQRARLITVSVPDSARANT